jgi:hypothetical protein
VPTCGLRLALTWPELDRCHGHERQARLSARSGRACLPRARDAVEWHYMEWSRGGGWCWKRREGGSTMAARS